MTPSSTTRLILREASEDDAAFMLRLLTESSWKRFIRRHDVDSEALAQDYLKTRIISGYGKGYGFWIVELRESGEAMGICGLIKRYYLEQVDLGFGFLEQYWGQGYAKEASQAAIGYAFETLKLPCLAAVTSPENTPSIRLLERLGFQLSGEMTDPDSERIAVYKIRKR